MTEQDEKAVEIIQKYASGWWNHGHTPEIYPKPETPEQVWQRLKELMGVEKTMSFAEILLGEMDNSE